MEFINISSFPGLIGYNKVSGSVGRPLKIKKIMFEWDCPNYLMDYIKRLFFITLVI